MYNFKDLIARSYIEHTEEKEYNIAHTYYQEFQAVRAGSNASYIFSKEQFYKKLIKELEALIRSTVHNYNVDSSYFDAIEETKDFKSWEKNDLKRKQEIYDDLGYNYTFTPTNWEETKNAKELDKALEEGLELNDPVRIISPSKTIQADDLVLRKSKLEFLKSEAVRARDANNIYELDDDISSTNTLIEPISFNNSIDYKSKKEEALKEVISKALEIIKPLGGIYKLESLLNEPEMIRLSTYITSIFRTGELPTNAFSFPITILEIEFIRKTIHFVYLLNKKKDVDEFINLLKLFENFKGYRHSTIRSNFAAYNSGSYEEKLKEISL